MKSAYSQILGIEDNNAATEQGTPQNAGQTGGTQGQGTQTEVPKAVQTPETPKAEAPKAAVNEENPVAVQNTETPAIPQTEEKKPTVDERMAEWQKANPEPTRRMVEAPVLENTLSYQDILDKYAAALKSDPKVEKRKRINKSIAALGDTLSAIINAAGVTSGANNMKMDPADSMSEKWKKKYMEDEAAAKDLRDKWFALQMKAAGLEGAENDRKLQRYNAALAKADSDYNTAKRNWDTAYGRQQRSYERQDEAEQKAQDKADEADYRKQRLDLDRDKVNETKNYHSRSLGIQQQRADNEKNRNGGKNGEKFRIGEWRSNRTYTKEELSTLAARMFEGGLIPVGDYNSANMGVTNFAPLIEKAARTKKGSQIMESNGFVKD